MNKDSPISHVKIAFWSLGICLAASYSLNALGYRWLAMGMLFGLFIMLFSWKLIDITLGIAFKFTSPDFMKAASFMLYHARFALIVLIMFLVIPKTNLYFGIGTFLGFLIPKFVLGTILLKNRSEEWWLKRLTPDTQKFHSENSKEAVGQLPERNPFEFDPVEEEVKRYFQTQKGEFKC